MRRVDHLVVLEVPVGSRRLEAGAPVVRGGRVTALTADGHPHLVQRLGIPVAHAVDVGADRGSGRLDVDLGGDVDDVGAQRSRIPFFGQADERDDLAVIEANVVDVDGVVAVADPVLAHAKFPGLGEIEALSLALGEIAKRDDDLVPFLVGQAVDVTKEGGHG